MKIKDLENKHKDEIIFVIGSGPSLHFVNPDLINDYTKICVNASIMKFSGADYFLSDDEDIVFHSFFQKDLLLSSAICLFYRKKLEGLTNLIPKERTIFFDHKLWYNPATKEKPTEGLVMTKDANLPVIGARNSLASAVHFAYIMGAKKIVILGADCCYDGNKKYFWEYDGEKKVKRLDNRAGLFFPKRKINNVVVDTSTIDFMAYWRELAEQAKKQNIDIINASGGIMDAFPREKIEDILKPEL